MLRLVCLAAVMMSAAMCLSGDGNTHDLHIEGVHDLGEVAVLKDDEHEPKPKMSANAAKVHQSFLNTYYPDGRNEMHVSAWAHVRQLRKPTAFGEDGLLGESDEDLMRVFSKRKQHQPLKSMGYKGKGEKCLNIKKAHIQNGDYAKTGTTVHGELSGCGEPTLWYYNRFTKRLELEAVPDQNNDQLQVEKCLHREPQKEDKKKKETLPAIVIKDCNDDEAQVWRFECDAWVFDFDLKGEKVPRILSGSDPEESSSLKPEASKYYGKAENKWFYKEVVRHSRCRTKRYKTMKFDGTLGNTISFKRFANWPMHGVTVMMWMKPKRGTVFSYASDGVPAPPYKTQLAVSIEDQTGRIYLDLFDKQFDTKVISPKHKWFHVAVQWETKFGKLMMFLDGEEVFTESTFNMKPTSFEGRQFVSGGCMMLGQKAKRPCRQRLPETSYKGEVTDFLVVQGAISKKSIKDYMFKPVDPKYLATITEQLPQNEPDSDQLLMAYLTRQYGSQELDTEYPPICALEEEDEEPEVYDMAEDQWAKKCQGSSTSNSECFMGHDMQTYAQGDVHYRSFKGCYYDDQAVGPMTALQMKPEFHTGWPLLIQYFPTPLASGASWAQKGKTITKTDGSKVTIPGTLSMVSACAIKFKDERIASGFGGWGYRVGGQEWGRFSQTCDFESMGETKEGCGCFSATGGGCKKSKYFTGSVSTSSFNIEMADGLKVSCSPAVFRMRVPRKLEGKFDGMLGNTHKSTNRDKNSWTDYTVGNNEAAVKKMNAEFTKAKYPATVTKVTSSDQIGTQDLVPMVVGKQVPSMMNPQDSPTYCRTGGQYHGSASHGPFNGNRPWKGVTKMIYSWMANNKEIPNIFGKVQDKITDVENKYKMKWDMFGPAAGTIQNRPPGAGAQAEKACESLKEWKKNFDDCKGDVLGGMPASKAIKKNRKVAAQKQKVETQKAKLTTVRDSSGGGWHANWVGHPNWGCVDEFSVQITEMYKKKAAAEHRAGKMAEMCKCKHKYLGVCSYDHFICIADIKLPGWDDGKNAPKRILKS